MIKEYAGPILDEIGEALKDMDYDVLWKMVAEIHGANRIFFHAIGRPELPMKNFAMYLKHFGYRVHVVGDVTCPAIKPGDVFFAVSGTGETNTTLNMVKKCREIGEIKVLLMTAAEKSTIGDLADLVLRVDCPLRRLCAGLGAARLPAGAPGQKRWRRPHAFQPRIRILKEKKS